MKYQSVAVLALSLLLAACEPADKVEDTTSANIELRFGHDMPLSSPQHLAAIHFSELVKAKTNGALSITVFPRQELGTDRQMTEMAKNGELDFVVPPTAKLSHLMPELQVFDLPFLFPDRDTAYSILDGNGGKRLLLKAKEHGLVGLGFWESGFKQLTSNKAINSKEDFIGQRFRIMESVVLRDQFKFWGADTVVIDFGETYTALEDAVADGQENPLTSIIGMNFHKVQKHLILSNHGYLGQLFAVSEKTFNKLDDQYQQAILESALETTKFQRKEAERMHDSLVEQLKSEPISVSTLDPQTRQFLVKQSRSVLEKYRMVLGTELIEQILQKQDEAKQFSDNQLVIALDADLSGNSAMSGLAIRRGIELALDEINKAGGILGKQVTLVAKDNSMIPARGMDNLKSFKDIPNLLAVFSGISSPVVLSQLDYIHQNEILFLDPWAAATPIVDNKFDPNYVFRLSVRDEYAADFLLKEALSISDNVGLLLVNNGWGRSNHKALTASLADIGLAPTHTAWFDWGESDFSTMVDDLAAKGTGVIIYVGNPVEGSKFIHELAKQPLPPAVISHWGITGSEFAKMAAPSLDNIDLRVLQTFSFINNDSPKARQLAKRYHSKYFTKRNEDIVAPVGTAHAYDLTLLLAKAANKTKSAKMGKVRDELETIKHFPGLLKTYEPPFKPDNHDALDRSDFIFARYKDGHLYPVGK